MFDIVRCEFPLPVAGANALEFQTKDLPTMWLEEYRIATDGQLWHWLYTHDEQQDKRLPIGQEKESWSGSMNFYSSFDDYNGSWIEFQAHFVEGKLTHIHLVEDRKEFSK